MPFGLGYVYRGTAEYCLWNEIQEIFEFLTEESLKLIKLPGGSINLKNIDRSLVIRRKDGKTFKFTVNTVKGLHRLAVQLREMSEFHGIPWRTEAIEEIK